MADPYQQTLFDRMARAAKDYKTLVRLLPMQPEEEQDILMRYSFANSNFGKLLIASTEKGICYCQFVEEEHVSILNVEKYFPYAQIIRGSDNLQTQATDLLKDKNTTSIVLHLKCTPFQLKVWRALLQIPFGHTITYANLSKEIGNPSAARAVGTAVGSNPVAYLIPCHRVVRSDGGFGGYRWGIERKKAILDWEFRQLSHQ